MIYTFFVATLFAMPCEYVIDCGAAPVPRGYSMTIKFQARDGTTLTAPIDVGDGPPAAAQRVILWVIKDNDWVPRPGSGTAIIVTGTKKKSQVASVTVKSTAGVPTVRWVPLPPKK